MNMHIVCHGFEWPLVNMPTGHRINLKIHHNKKS